MNKNEIIEVTEKEYGTILAESIRISCQSFDKICEECKIENDFINWLTYYEYVLFIAESLLKTRYSEDKIERCILYTWNNIFNHFQSAFQKKVSIKLDEIKESFIKEYINLRNEKINLLGLSDSELKIAMDKYVKRFLQDIDIKNDFFIHLEITQAFSGFIIYHTEDILNDKIIIK